MICGRNLQSCLALASVHPVFFHTGIPWKSTETGSTCFCANKPTPDFGLCQSVLLEKLPYRAAEEPIMADFERATWAALRKIIPGKDIIGCHFHWSQAVWLKVQEVELQVQYSEDINVYHTDHSIFALPFLPVANVQAGFDNIRANAVANNKLDLLLNYVKRYWMDLSSIHQECIQKGDTDHFFELF